MFFCAECFLLLPAVTLESCYFQFEYLYFSFPELSNVEVQSVLTLVYHTMDDGLYVCVNSKQS